MECPAGTTSTEVLSEESTEVLCEEVNLGVPAEILQVALETKNDPPYHTVERFPVQITPDQISDALQKLVEHASPSFSISTSPPSNPSTFRDVHSFDGHLEKISIPEYDRTTKEALFTQLKTVLPAQAGILDQFINRVATFDSSNSYQADDLLVHLILHNKGEDLLRNLREQLEDIATLGPCPQGKVTRILSLIQAFC
jgi:hypothetical protein